MSTHPAVEPAARFLAATAWPGEAADIREQWFRRLIAEPDLLESTYVKALERHAEQGQQIITAHAMVRDLGGQP